MIWFTKRFTFRPLNQINTHINKKEKYMGRKEKVLKET